MDTIWYRDPVGFFSPRRLPEFVPTSSMTYAQQLNAVMRFGIYFSLIMYLVNQNSLVFYVAIFIAILTMSMYEFYLYNQKLKRELYSKAGVAYDNHRGMLCSIPSKNNPYMNVLMNEYTEFPNRPPACNIKDKKVDKKAEAYFEHNLYRDVDDVWSRKTASRNWYTTPVTTIPNNATEFAQALYGKATTCKSGDGTQCYTNIYHPYNM